MEYKKYSYILVLILMLIVGIDTIYAKRKPAVSEETSSTQQSTSSTQKKECYYISQEGATKELKVVTTIKWGADIATANNMGTGSTVTIHKYNGTSISENVPLLNWRDGYLIGGNKGIGSSNDCTANKTCFGYYYTKDTFPTASSPTCPMYIVVEYNKEFADEYYAWGTNSITLAQQAVNSTTSKAIVAYASNYKDGKQITHDMYYNTFVSTGTGEIDESTLECADIFTDDIMEMISDILQYPKIIVPILLILLGILDFAKAVISSKEDEMKKAQSKFIKRLIAGVAVFFVPLFIDIVMNLSNYVWEGMGYTTCNFR